MAPVSSPPKRNPPLAPTLTKAALTTLCERCAALRRHYNSSVHTWPCLSAHAARLGRTQDTRSILQHKFRCQARDHARWRPRKPAACAPQVASVRSCLCAVGCALPPTQARHLNMEDKMLFAAVETQRKRALLSSTICARLIPVWEKNFGQIHRGLLCEPDFCQL